MNHRKINAKTEVCGVIGNPIDHSLSPLMHNTVFQSLGLNFVYLAFSVKEKKLHDAVEGMKAFGIEGLNVTIPHKVTIIELLDEINELASEIGAVNTVVNRDGILTGYNTDGLGALKALKEGGENPKHKDIVMLGAGGAGKAVAYFIGKENPNRLTIMNPTLSKAVTLAKRIHKKFDVITKGIQPTDRNLEQELNSADILINCSPIGMAPKTDETPVPPSFLKKDLLVMDIVYNPIETKLLNSARRKGLETIDGLSMFVHQGAAAFEMWTGESPPKKLMRKVVKEELTNET